MMSFLASRHFKVSLTVGILLATLVMAAPSVWPELPYKLAQPCDEPPGTVLAQGAHAADADVAFATITGLVACIDVGSITIQNATGDNSLVSIDIRAEGRGAERLIADTHVVVSQFEGTLYVSQTRAAREGWFVGGNGADVHIRVHLAQPDPVQIVASTDVGSISLVDVAAAGTSNLRTDVGDITASLSQIGAGLRATTDVGDIELTLPLQGGLYVDAFADVGDIALDPAFVTTHRTSDPPSTTHRANTPDGPQATHVDVRLRTDVGDIGVQLS